MTGPIGLAVGASYLLGAVLLELTGPRTTFVVAGGGGMLVAMCTLVAARPSTRTDRRVLLVSGSTRDRSTNTALCRTAVACAPAGITAVCHPGIDVLPHFNPDDDHDPLPATVAQLRAAIAEADAVLFCTPEYAGTLPGSLKNLLDWTVGGVELTGKPVAWMRAAPDARRGDGAHATLATVLGYVQAAVVEDACRHVPITGDAVGPDGLIADPDVRAAVAATITALLHGVPARPA